MQSKAQTVDAYMLEVPPERLVVMQQLRSLVQEILVGYEESMIYGMPSYGHGDAIAVGFNSQKNYIAFYFPPPIVSMYKELLMGMDCGKSCLRFKKPEKVDFAVITTLLQATCDLDARVTRPNLPEN